MKTSQQFSQNFFRAPLTEANPTDGCGVVYENRFIAIELVPSRFGPYSTLVSGTGRGAVTMIVHRERVLMVVQPRYATGETMWELPRGGANAEESNAEAALREVAEETGLRLAQKDLVDLGEIIPDTGIMGTRVGLFFAGLPDDWASNPTQGDPEIDEVRWVPVTEVAHAAAHGDIVDAMTVATVLRAQVRGLV